MKILKVKTHPVDVPTLASAALRGDSDEVGDILDDALEFRGLAGGVVEAADGPVFDEVAELLVKAVAEAVKQRLG